MSFCYRIVCFIFFLLITTGFTDSSLFAQNLVRTPFSIIPHRDSVPQLACGVDRWLARMRSNPVFARREKEMNQAILTASGTPDDDSYVLPVVVHIISENPASVTDLQIENAIQDLNDAFSKSGAYSASVGANTRIQFCLARTDPQRGTSTGITRTQSFFANMDQDIEDAQLKALSDWDPAHYINIWYVNSIQSEILSQFNCGQWNRNKENGYASMPPDADSTDGIVISSFGHLLAHEMGHYLGLYHTFEGLNCVNNNCATDGDRVCDTPPDASIYNSISCSQPENSCHTDTLSGFTTDVPDLIADFMDYGNDECHNEFTEGQAARMRATITTQRPGLLQSRCSPACTESSLASFTRNKPYPLPTDLVSFTNTSTGASSFQWLVNGTVVSTAFNFSQVFGSAGKFVVTLKAFNGNSTCFSSFTDNVIINCGVTARFYPDKRVIASKVPIYPDSILFTNRSVNATSYQWLMSNDSGMAAQVVSTATNLNYVFANPSNYSLRLIASNGTCADTSHVFNFSVLDPTPDGVVSISSVNCYQETKLKVSFVVCNYGYAPFLPGTPISFYDADPRLGNANRLGAVFNLPDTVKGNCCGNTYQVILNIGRAGLNQLFAVFNDNGLSSPFKLPNTSLQELRYDNNFSSDTGFQFHVSIVPPQISGSAGTSIQLNASAGPDLVQTFLWTSSTDLSCSNCASPVITLDSNETKKLLAESVNQCYDSALAIVKVGVGDDYSISISSVQCIPGDSVEIQFSVCNNFQSGILPKGLAVSFYNADPGTGSAQLMGSPFVMSQNYLSGCTDFVQHIRLAGSGLIYAVVNDSAILAPVSLPGPNSLPENNYGNNQTSFSYSAPLLQIIGGDTTVTRNQPFPLSVADSGTGTVNWSTGSGYTLSCTQCATTQATIQQNASIAVQFSTAAGCVLKGAAQIRILAPDMTVQILDNECFNDSSTLMRFKICMNNGYDSIPANLPVAFYDADPGSGSAHLLTPVFFTADSLAGSCLVFNQVIRTPATGNVYAVVNDNGTGPAQMQDTVFAETNYQNNTDHAALNPFTVSISPADTSIGRGSSIPLRASLTEAASSHFRWEPESYLSCISCLEPIATPPGAIRYLFIAQNQYNCIDTAYSNIKTFTGGTVSIPNGFTPNGDGLNDVFYILGGQTVTSIREFAVYDRWGEKVFEISHAAPNDPNYGWNGFFKGQKAETGTYVYIATIQFTDGHTQLYKGTVTLMR